MSEKFLGMSWRAACAAACCLIICSIAHPAQPVLQRGYDAAVTGANLHETLLTTSNVNRNSFGKLFSLAVDDAVFAQPLYVPGVDVAGKGTRNVVYVATMSDTLYAFDADTGGTPLWSVNLATRVGATPVQMARFAFSGNRNIVGNLGVLSTPVIDPSTNLLYVVACTLENGTMAYRLHAVDIRDGSEPLGSGVRIAASYKGSTFDARYQTQRVSLALAGNQVVFGFAAVELEYAGGYVGWMMAYDKRTLKRSGVFATVTTGNRGGGVWQSGRPPVIDASGFAYVFVGNAYGQGYDGVNNFSESVLKLDLAHGLKLIDWFTPSNWSALDAGDLDLTSSGPLLIPGANRLVGGGKSGVFYVLDTTDLGHLKTGDTQIPQKLSVCPAEIIGGPVYWQRSAARGGSLLYDWCESDWAKAWSFAGSVLSSSPVTQGSGSQYWPGGILTLSANGDQAGSGILWASVVNAGDESDNPPRSGTLHAYDASDLGHELWNSAQNASRDKLGNFGKFVPPMVANGRVYAATWSNQVVVYGLLSSYELSSTAVDFGTQAVKVASAPQTITLTNTGRITLPLTSIAITGPDAGSFGQSNDCGGSLDAGASCTLSIVFTPSGSGGAGATLGIRTSSTAGNQAVQLTGTGAVPAWSLSASTLDFGSVQVDTASPAQSVVLRNTGVVSLPIEAMSLSTAGSRPFAMSSDCGSPVPAGASCSISVVFDPDSAGTVSAALVIATGAGGGTQQVALGGSGYRLTFSLSSASLDFGDQALNEASLPAALVLTNTSPVALSVSSVTITPASGSPFTQSSDCGAALSAGASCTIQVLFKPANAGPAQASLDIGTAAGNASTTLAGNGIYRVVLTAEATTVTVGEPVILAWTSAPDAVCTASGGRDGDHWAGTMAASGSIQMVETSAGSVTYALDCLAHGVAEHASVEVTHTLPAVTLSVSPASVTVGQSVTLTWTSTDAGSCSANGGTNGDGWAGDRPLSGSASVKVSQSGTINYGLTCIAGSQSASASQRVQANDPPSSGGGALDLRTLLALLALAVLGSARRRRQLV
ncbi:MAG: choice-of-anchor D domain-containing protein [Steroidobacteraceae bacterium]